MRLFSVSFPLPPVRRRVPNGKRGFTLVEVAMSIAILAVTSVGGVSGFLLLNKYAANLRNLAIARSLCQERIEQALSLPFSPKSSSVPLAPASDLITYPPSVYPNGIPILGPLTSYNTATGAYTGTSSNTTSEAIIIATQSENATPNSIVPGSANVTFNRTTNVASTSLGVVQFTATVSYVFRGQTYSTSMVTFRSPN